MRIRPLLLFAGYDIVIVYYMYLYMHVHVGQSIYACTCIHACISKLSLSVLYADMYVYVPWLVKSNQSDFYIGGAFMFTCKSLVNLL